MSGCSCIGHCRCRPVRTLVIGRFYRERIECPQACDRPCRVDEIIGSRIVVRHRCVNTTIFEAQDVIEIGRNCCYLCINPDALNLSLVPRRCECVYQYTVTATVATGETAPDGSAITCERVVETGDVMIEWPVEDAL